MDVQRARSPARGPGKDRASRIHGQVAQRVCRAKPADPELRGHAPRLRVAVKQGGASLDIFGRHVVQQRNEKIGLCITLGRPARVKVGLVSQCLTPRCLVPVPISRCTPGRCDSMGGAGGMWLC